MRKSYYFLFIFSLLLLNSCSGDESLDVNDTVVNQNEENKDTDNNDNKTPENEISENRESTPCDFDLSKVIAGQNIEINCTIDLKGEEITLPENVTLIFKQGDILNGTINFTGQGKIDGMLLNSSLKLTGEISLTDTTFEFTPSRWSNIVEGSITREIALKNTAEFENLMFYISSLGGTIFEVDQFDAFFEISTVTSTTSDQNFRPSKEAVNIPSNLHLKMSSNTILRTFTAPSDRRNGSLLAVRDEDNVKISGGNLIGDALTRQYVGKDPGDIGSRLITVHASRSVEIDNVNIELGSAGGVDIHSLGFPFNPDYIPSENVVVKNCTFKNVRRIATILTDGYNIKIEGNTYINSGQPLTSGDNGGNVGYAINLETFRQRDENGKLLEFQRVSNVVVRNNTEKNSRIGFLLVLGCSDVIAENNQVETRMAINFSNRVKLQSNNFVGSEKDMQSFAIFGAGGDSEFTFDNEISSNNITGNYGTGISLLTRKCRIYDNNINNCEVGVQLTESKELEIYNNKIKARNIGVFSNLTFVDDINIMDNTIEAEAFHVKLTEVNQKLENEQFKLNLKNNRFLNESPISLLAANGIEINENNITGRISLNKTTNINIISNTIKPNNSDGLLIEGNQNNVVISNNTIYEPTGAERFECINNKTGTNGITITDNSCN